MSIAIVGAGYVGLVSGACLAELGHDVICVDKDRGKILALNNGQIPIFEPGLDAVVARNVEAGRLRFSFDLAASVKGREAVFIAVGTPTDAASGRADLSYVFAAAEEIAANLDKFAVIVTKSTVPVGTNRKIMAVLTRGVTTGLGAAVASNPEFLREGAAIGDFMQPDRIVVGAEDPRAAALMEQIYAPLTRAGAPLLVTGLETAEMVKYAANAFLAVKISFINEVSDLCEAVGADVAAVAGGIGADTRIGPAFLQVGPGWGGSCFPKDTRALDSTARDEGVRLRVVEASIAANTHRKRAMAERIRAACGGSVLGKRIAMLGVTFKGQTDDMRESPALDIVPILLADGAQVRAFDPAQPKEARRLLPEVVLARSATAAAEGADVLVVMTDWAEFEHYDLSVLAARMTDPVMVDLRNLFDAKAALGAGFRRYEGLGRQGGEAVPPPAAAAKRSALRAAGLG